MTFFQTIKSYFNLFKEAVRGKEQDFTEGSINKAIFFLSIPMILEMAMESLFAVVDIFFVSRLNDSNAVAAVGLTESCLAIVYSLAMGLGMGATAMVARRVGEKNPSGAGAAAVQSIYIGLAASLLVSLVGIFFYQDLLILMGASAEVIEAGAGYTRWMLVGNFSIMFLFIINAIFRGAGNPAIAMRSLWLGNIFNMILDPIFIFGFGPIEPMGVEGAAIATNIGRSIGVLYQLYHLIGGKSVIKIYPKTLQVEWEVIWKLLKLSIGGIGQFLISSASWVFLTRIMATFGSSAVAGYTIAIRVIIFTILPSWGLANAAATLVGQNLGANQPDRAEKSVWLAGKMNMIFLGGVSIFFFFISEPIMRFFTDQAEVVANGTLCLQVVAFGYILYGYGMVVSQSFNGAGDTRTPTLLNLIGFWGFQIPVAYLLAVVLKLGPLGVFLAIALAESVMAVVGIVIFRKGKWKQIKI
jgi:putative MATE family efflux protein